MSKFGKFEPDWTVHPGELVDEFMEQDGYSKEDLSKNTGWSLEFINEILSGNISITNDIADKLSKTIGMKKHFWLKAQETYENDLLRLNKAKQREDKIHSPIVLRPLAVND
jgi:addiction module HigA family antidote